MLKARSGVPARAALAVSLLVAWLNFLLTVKWAHFPGALNGWKRPFYGLALLIATAYLFSRPKADTSIALRGLNWLITGAVLLLVAAYLSAFPPATWSLVPFADDWAPRFQSTADGLRLLKRGAMVGWQWGFLGGHQTSGDLSQSLTIIGALPMLLVGDRVGFHLLHLVMVAAIPWMVYRDAAQELSRDVARLAVLFALICATGFFGTIMPSGDTNSIAGVFAAMLALTGSRLARQGQRAGGVVQVLGLTLAIYSHVAFFMYAVLFLAVEAAFYRDRGMALRTLVAAAAAFAAALPLNFELLRYPSYFITNNIIYAPGGYDWLQVARKIYYNVEILLHPHRWFNDYLSLTCVFLAVVLWIACYGARTRAQLYALLALMTIAILRLDVPEAGYLFARQMHMLAALVPIPLAWFVVTHTGNRPLAWALVAVISLYVQTGFSRVSHVNTLRDFDAGLVDRLAALDGNLVLLESSPHRDLDSDPQRRTERTPFGVHFEMMVPVETERRLYGQAWDCWHWTPFRGQVVAGGSFRGQAIGLTPVPAFTAELRKWGVRHLLVWSEGTRRYLDAAPSAFSPRGTRGAWAEYELADSDPRAVVVPEGYGTLEDLDPLGATVRLAGARKDSQIVVRTNYFPAWAAHDGRQAVPLFSAAGQLAFQAPRDGDYTVTLRYPRRHGLLAAALAAFLLGAALAARTCATRSSPSAAA